MRVETVPNTVNGKTGLICTFVGSPRDLEGLTISEVLELRPRKKTLKGDKEATNRSDI
jgi:hypothetical protein